MYRKLFHGLLRRDYEYTAFLPDKAQLRQAQKSLPFRSTYDNMLHMCNNRIGFSRQWRSRELVHSPANRSSMLHLKRVQIFSNVASDTFCCADSRRLRVATETPSLRANSRCVASSRSLRRVAASFWGSVRITYLVCRIGRYTCVTNSSVLGCEFQSSRTGHSFLPGGSETQKSHGAARCYDEEVQTSPWRSSKDKSIQSDMMGIEHFHEHDIARNPKMFMV